MATTRPQLIREDAASDEPRGLESLTRSGLNFDVARSLSDVIDAWQLVYQSYMRSGLIDPNPYELHTTSKAIGSQTAVMLARLGAVPAGTLSAIVDHPGGLPLDSVYQSELDDLRRQGCSLMELGLFADRREDFARSFAAMIELMRLSTYFGIHHGVTDAVIGVHPRHARFYRHYLYFDTAGPTKTYSVVKDRPVVLLRLNWREKSNLTPPPPGVQYILQNRLRDDFFEGHYAFDPASVENSLIARYLGGMHS